MAMAIHKALTRHAMALVLARNKACHGPDFGPKITVLIRKVTKNKRVFPSDESVFKTLYLTIDYITRKWILPIRDWNEAMAHFLIKFDDRIQINN